APKWTLRKLRNLSLTIFILLFQANVPNVKVFMKSHSVLRFARSIAVFRTKIGWNLMKFYWKDKHFCITNNFKKMKNFFWITIIALSLTACKSGNNQSSNKSNTQPDEIIGRWELVEQTNIKNPGKSYPEGLP